VFHGRLLGQELALWRDAAGQPNAWENRCPHRGVRLTLGLHLGSEVRCLYHGLRYASGTGRCTAIPSLGNRELPRQLNICVKTFAVREKYGLVWARLGECAHEPAVRELDGVPGTTLRSVVIGAAAERVADALAGYRFVPGRSVGAPAISDAACTVDAVQELTFVCTSVVQSAAKSVAESIAEKVVLIAQPADRDKTIVHGVAIVGFTGGDACDAAVRRSVLRHHNAQLCALRDALEAGSATSPAAGQARDLLEESA
jgi:nitrite reductase/ring-hydroxylating ferredoxin subunit